MAKRGKTRSGGEAELTMKVDSSAVDKAAKDLPKALSGEVDTALGRLGDEFVSATRRAIRGGPATGGRRPPYRPHNSREQAARGVDFQVRDGKLTLASDPSKMPAGRREFPAAWNKSSWSHPVFGRRSSRVTQRGAGAWWKPERYADRAEQLITTAAERAASKVDK
jgi:hypothetical protein